MNRSELIEFLNFKVEQYNTSAFIDHDPVLIPHMFSKKADIEISGFLTSVLSWGNRKAIQNAARQLMELMDHSPFEFISDAGPQDLRTLEHYYYRTFKSGDIQFYIQALQNIYRRHQGLEHVFNSGYVMNFSTLEAIEFARNIFFEIPHERRHLKHFSSPASGSAAKRLNMFLRWMCRSDEKNVDFGIWKTISPKHLMCPLDVHSGNAARKLGLLNRKQNDRKAVEELTQVLLKFDPDDPVKYDYALFGLGVFEKF